MAPAAETVETPHERQLRLRRELNARRREHLATLPPEERAARQEAAREAYATAKQGDVAPDAPLAAVRRDRKYSEACLAAGGFAVAERTPAGTRWSYPSTHRAQEHAALSEADRDRCAAD